LILFRLVRLLVLAALLVVVLGVVGVIAGRPFVERLAARSIEDRLGTPVTVAIDTPLRPGVVRGDVGTVTVRAASFERDGLRLAGARATYRGVRLDMADLLSGDVQLHYASVGFEGALTESALRAYLRPVLDTRGLPSKDLRVTIADDRATLRAGQLRVSVTARVAGRSAIALVPVSGSPLHRQALASPIRLGPHPDGVRLTGVTLRAGTARIAGRGDAGEIRA
jgi:hypothetical protein